MEVLQDNKLHLEYLMSLSSLVSDYINLGMYRKDVEDELELNLPTVLATCYHIIEDTLNHIGIRFTTEVYDDPIDRFCITYVYSLFIDPIESTFEVYLKESENVDMLQSILDEEDTDFIVYEFIKYLNDNYHNEEYQMIVNRLFGKIYSNDTFIYVANKVINKVTMDNDPNTQDPVPTTDELNKKALLIKNIQRIMDEIKQLAWPNREIDTGNLFNKVINAISYDDYTYFDNIHTSVLKNIDTVNVYTLLIAFTGCLIKDIDNAKAMFKSLVDNLVSDNVDINNLLNAINQVRI